MQVNLENIVETTMNELLTANNTFTTLELKDELRKKFSYIRWYQHTKDGIKGVSEYVFDLLQAGKLVVIDDNGIYRTYSSPKSLPSLGTVKAYNPPTSAPALNPQQRAWVTRRAKSQSGSRQALKDAIMKSGGKFIRVTFIKKGDGKERTINGNVKGVNGNIVTLNEAVKAKAGTDSIRSFDINTVKSARVNGNVMQF